MTAQTAQDTTETEQRGLRKSRIGIVSSNKMDKTIVVSVESYIKHKLYKKFIKNSRTFMAHDENNECEVGDRVRIMETRPLSKLKRWRLVQIVEKRK